MDLKKLILNENANILPFAIVTDLNGNIIEVGEFFKNEINSDTHFSDHFSLLNSTDLDFSELIKLKTIKLLYKTISTVFTFISNPIFDKEKEIVLFNNVLFDSVLGEYGEEFDLLINEKKVIEKQRDFYFSILDNLPSDIAIFDSKQRYLYVNPQGVKNKEIRKWIIGKTDLDYCKLKQIDTSLAKKRGSLFEELNKTNETVDWEDSVEFKKNEFKTFYRQLTPIFDSESNTKFIIGYGVDITKIKKAENESKISEENYQKLFNTNLVGIFKINSRGQFIKTNTAFAKIFGFENEEDLKVFKYTDILENPEVFTQALTVFRKEGKLVNYVINNKLKSGKTISTLINANLVRENNRIFFEGTLLDVSKIKEDEEKISEAHKKLQLLESFLNHSTDGLQVCNEEGKMIYVNPESAKRIGISANEVANYNVKDFETTLNTDEKWLQHVKELKEKGNLKVESYSKNVKTNKIIPLEISITYQKINGEGYIIASSRDIKKQKQYQKSLREKDMFLEILNSAINSTSLVSETDIFGSINYANENFCKVSQYSLEELIGKNHNIVSSGFHSPDFWTTIWDKIKNKETWTGEIKNKAKDGSFYWGFTIVHPVLNDYNEISSFLSITQDITSIKNIEKELEHQIDLQNLLMKIATDFINLPIEKLPSELDSALKEVGEFVNSDRAYLFDYNHNDKTINNLFEWCREGVEPQIDLLQKVPFSEVPIWIENHFKGLPIDVPSVQDLPKGRFKELLEVQSIKSLYAIPLMKGNTCIGFIGFDSVNSFHNYSDEQKNILLLFSDILVNVYTRIESLENLEKKQNEINSINANLEKAIVIETEKNNQLTRILTDQEILSTIGEMASGVAHDLNTPLGAIKAGAENLQFTLQKLFQNVILKCTQEQLDFAIKRAEEKNKELFIGGLQFRKEASEFDNLLKDKFPLLENRSEISSLFVRSRIDIDETDLINEIISFENKTDFLNLIFKIQTIKLLLDTILYSSERSNQVVKNLRQLIKSETDTNMNLVNLKHSITNVVNIFKYLINGNYEVVIDIETSIEFEAYESKLYQLWSNLLKNAIEAAPLKTIISISAVETNDFIKIKFENEGDQIPLEIQEKIFDKFYSTKKAKNGTGLGLSIVKRVVEEHHATINLTSIDEKTCFEVTFDKKINNFSKN